MSESKKFIILKIIITLLCVGMLLLSCFCLKNVHRLVTIACLIVFGTFSVVIPSLSLKYVTFTKILIALAVLCSLTLVCFIILEISGILYKMNDFDTLKAFVLESKQWGYLTFFLITLFGVVVLPIPAAVTILLGVAIYGSWISFFISSAATILGSIICFFIGRSFGKKIIIWIFGQEKTQKYADFLARGKFAFIFMMLFPLFPDDLICMLAGITNMSKKFFIITMSVTRTFAIGVYCFLGNGEIIPFKGWGIPVWIGIFVAMIVCFVIVEKVLSKRKNLKSTKFNEIPN